MSAGPVDATLLSPKRWALAAASIIWLLGFGALNIFSLSGAGDATLPGLYTFRSATVGDGLLLPILAYSLVRSAGLQLGWSTVERRAIAITVVIAGLGAAALQIQWLLNPNPRRNWTLPAPHTFNAPGWYHAFFLVAASMFFAGAGAATWIRLHREARIGSISVLARLQSMGLFGVLSTSTAFLGLLTLDNIPPGADITVRSLLLPMAAIIIQVILLSSALQDGRARLSTASVFASSIPAIALCGLFLPGTILSWPSVLLTLCGAFGGAAFSSIVSARPGAERLTLVACIAICMAGPIYATSSRPKVEPVILAIGCTLAILLAAGEISILRVLRRDASDTWKTAFTTLLAVVPMLALGAAGRYYAQEPAASARYSGVAGAVAGALALALTSRAVRNRFDLVIEAEETTAPPTQLSNLKWAAYTLTSMIFGAALVSLVLFVMGTVSQDAWISGGESDYDSLIPLTIALSTVLILLWVVRELRRIRGFSPSLPLISGLVMIGWTGVLGRELAVGFGGLVQAIIAVVAATLASAFMFESIISNAAYLHNVRIDWAVLFIAISSALASFTTMVWMAGPMLASQDITQEVNYSLVALPVGVLAFVLLPYLAAGALMGARPPRQYMPATPLAGVLQDGFVVLLLTLSVGWVPNLFLVHIEVPSTCFGAILFYFGLLSAAYVYVMENNIGHVHRERNRLAQQAASTGVPLSVDEQRALENLKRHVERQNRLAIVALVPLGLLVIFYELSGFKKNAFRRILKVD